MVVRIAYSRDGSLGPSFDEMQNRSARNLQYEDWTEFVVVWRKDRLELYDDYVCAVYIGRSTLTYTPLAIAL